MIRLGLCCLFREAPIKFRRTTAAYLKAQQPADRVRHLAAICRDNADALYHALEFCRANGIGAFRINSQILPVITHPDVGYRLPDLPNGNRTVKRFRECKAFSRRNDIRTSFHPDQFLVLSSPDAGVVRRSLADLAYQAQVAHWVGADVINIHGGGGYGDKPSGLGRLVAVIEALPTEIKSRLTLENDDRTYTPADLLPVCRRTGIPLVYDVHHHRCLSDGRSVEETTQAAIATWDREPLFHLSSPLNGWHHTVCRPHHDFIQAADFPHAWQEKDLTVEVEAKAKEIAVVRLRRSLAAMGVPLHPPLERGG